MPYRDEQGHFISQEEAEARGIAEVPADEVDEETEEEPALRGWAAGVADQPIFIDTGRGQTVQASPGDPFIPTLERLAEDAHYGGYFRVFLNGSEVINPEDSPDVIESGMRIAITSYDKVGLV